MYRLRDSLYQLRDSFTLLGLKSYNPEGQLEKEAEKGPVYEGFMRE